MDFVLKMMDVYTNIKDNIQSVVTGGKFVDPFAGVDFAFQIDGFCIKNNGIVYQN